MEKCLSMRMIRMDGRSLQGDELPSAQWEHTFVMTEHGVEVLTH